MMKQWLTVLLLIAAPTFASAECGWLLMIPQHVGAGAKLPPFAEWTQSRAFDSAGECQGVADGVAKAEAIRPLMDRVREGNFNELTLEEQVRVTFLYGRCLPASLMPVR